MLAISAGLFLFLSQDITGIVTDQSGRPVPRAIVQIVAADGTPAASTFTDADGAFRVANAPDGCRVQASLTGFASAAANCSSTAMTLKLSVAPVAEHVVVSATRTEAPAGQVGAAVTVFDASDIDRLQQPLLADLLRGAPGTTIVREGAPGAVTSLFVRGGESDYTKVLLDGIPLNEPGGAFDLSNITTQNLERVEFVRGANSALYGSDAMTGVIQLFTRGGTTSHPEVSVSFDGGSFSTARGSGSIAGRAGRFDYSGDVTGFFTDNEVPNNTFRNVTVSGAVGVRVAQNASVRFVGRSEDGRAGTPGQTAFGRPDLDAFFSRRDSVFGATFDQTSGALHQHATYGLSISHQRSANLNVDPPYTPSFGDSVAPFEFEDFLYDDRTDLRRHHASYQADGTWSRGGGTHVDTALVDWDGERATLTDALAGTTVPASRNNVGLSLQHQAMWSHVFVTAGVRVEHNASFGTATVPRVSAAWYAHTGSGTAGTTRLHASAGGGIKEPTILQSFSQNPFFLGNPDLRPERSRAIDAGVEQRLAHDRASVDVTWFDNRYRDIISTRTISFDPFTSQYFNIGLTRARGAELSGAIALVSGVTAKAGYAFTDSKILESATPEDPVFGTGNWAFRRPRHSGFVDVVWVDSRASLGLSGSIVGRRVDSDFSSLVPPLTSNDGYALWNLRGSLQVVRRLSVTLAIDNLTDRHYMEPLGYPALGRAVRGGIRVRF